MLRSRYSQRKEVDLLRDERNELRQKETLQLKLNFELEQLEAKYKLVLEEKEILQTNIVKLQALRKEQIDGFRVQKEQIERGLAQNANKEKMLRVQIGNLKKGIGGRGEQAEQLGKELRRVEERVKQCESRNNELAKKVFQSKEQGHKAASLFQANKKQLYEKKNKLKESHKANQALIQKLQALDSKAQTLEAREQALHQRIAWLQKEKHTRGRLLQERKRKIEETARDLRQLEEDGQMHSRVAAGLRTQLSNQKEREKDLDDKIQTLQQSLRSNDNQAEELEQRRDRLLDKRDKLCKENESALDQIEGNVRLVRAYEQLNKELQSQLQSMRQADEQAELLLRRSKGLQQTLQRAKGAVQASFRPISHMFN